MTALYGAGVLVYINVLGTSRVAYGVILASNSAAYIAGTVYCRRLLLRHGLRGAVRRGSVWSLAGGLGVAAFGIGVFVVANTVIQRHGEPAPRSLPNTLGGSTT